MPAGELADAVSTFVETFERIGRGLDFDIEVSASRPAPAAPGLRPRLFPEWAWGWDAWAAVAQAARRSGPTAAPVYAASVEARDLLLRSLEGDLDAWRRHRDRIFAVLDAMRASCQTVTAVPVPITPKRLAIPGDTGTPPLATRTAAPSQADGDQGDEGDEPSAIASKLKENPKRILKFLRREGATQSPGWNLSTIGEECSLTDGQVRRAAEHLRKHRLYTSDRGQAATIWLTPLGVQVADIVEKPARG